MQAQTAKNPFSVKTPETLTPKDIADLFIDVFSDFPKLLTAEHTFLHGARGTGKSMMLRYLEPQVQLAANRVDLACKLPYFAVHVPIKSPHFSLSELERLEGSPYWLMAEHFLVANILLRIVGSLKELLKDEKNFDECIESFYQDVVDLASSIGCDVDLFQSDGRSSLEKVKLIERLCEKERLNAKSYLGLLSFKKELVPYENPLFGYEDFFLPFVRLVKNLDVTPSGPLYLMLDDADNLPVRMQKIINGWVSFRTTDDVCLKISTQQKYRTWRTSQGVLIESSHDFSEIDISAVYTSKNFSHYFDRVESVVRRRLEISGFKNTSPVDFFPENLKQKAALEEVKTRIASEWDAGERCSSRRSDDVNRYFMSEYVKGLASKKKTNTLSYAGFKSMVNVSSGMIRFFLEPAARMYADLEATSSGEKFEYIPADVQDAILYKWSEEYVLEEFNKLRNDETSQDSLGDNKVEKLKKLINSLGELFQSKLLSTGSERRYISFMLTDSVTRDVQGVLDLAVEWGYLSQKTIAKKEGVGRNTQYTLNRRLAPHFKLDPSGYAAHMSITPEMIRLAMEDTKAFVRERLREASEEEKIVSQGAFVFSNGGDYE